MVSAIYTSHEGEKDVFQEYESWYGRVTCSICKPPRLLQRGFLKFIIFQILFRYMMGITSHSLTCTVRQQGKPTCSPSLAKCTGRTKTFPFVASVQHVRNVSLMIQSEECDMWSLLYSPRKLSSIAWQKLVTILDDYTFICGPTLSDLELSGRQSKVCICDLQCYNPLEKLYYSMNHDSICIHYCSEDNAVSVQGCYPQCEKCKHKDLEPVKKSLKLTWFSVALYVHDCSVWIAIVLFVPFVALTISKEVFTFPGLH